MGVLSARVIYLFGSGRVAGGVAGWDEPCALWLCYCCTFSCLFCFILIVTLSGLLVSWNTFAIAMIKEDVATDGHL